MYSVSGILGYRLFCVRTKVEKFKFLAKARLHLKSPTSIGCGLLLQFYFVILA
jgi:hypothetical protein